MYAKIVYQEEIRLLKLDQKIFEDLPKTLPTLFKTLLPSSFSLFFLDETNDLILIGSFEDLEFLEKTVKSPIKLFIKPYESLEKPKKAQSFEEITEEKKVEDKKTNENDKKPEKNNFSFVFFGVQCDGCNAKPITGVRYKCLSCENFDLCEACESKGVHQHHVFAKLKSPEQEAPKTNSSVPPIDLFKLAEQAQPFLKQIHHAFENKKCFFKEAFNQKNQGCCPGFKEETSETTKKPEKEDEVELNKKIEGIAQRLTEILGGNLSENIELVKGFKDNLDLSYILSILCRN